MGAATLCLFSVQSHAQQFTGPNTTTDPIYRSGNLGLGTMPVVPTASLQVDRGDVIFQSRNGGKVQFTNPNGEDGLSVYSNAGGPIGSFGRRADMRFNGSVLRIGCHALAGVVPDTSMLFMNTSGKFGIGILPASNAKLEINSGVTDASGLKFTRLNAGSTPIAPYGKVLTLDAAGEVVLARDSSNKYLPGNGIKFAAGNIINSLWTDANYNIEAADAAKGLSIGTSNGGPSDAAIYSLARAQDRAAVFGENTKNVAYPTPKYGVYGKANNIPGNGIGGYFEGGLTGVKGKFLYSGSNTLADEYIGVEGSSSYQNLSGSNTTIGVKGYGETLAGNSNIYGVYGYAYSQVDTSTVSIGVFGDNWMNGPNDYAMYALGRTYSTTGWSGPSDERLKKDIRDYNGAVELIKKLHTKSYSFRDDDKFAGIHFPKEKQVGFLAQELEQVIPEMVSEAPLFFNKHDRDPGNDFTEQYKAVNYSYLIPILTQAIKEQQEQIEMLRTQIGKTNTPPVFSGSSATDIGEEGYLGQNMPNPFSRSTDIQYRLPAGTQKGTIGIYDLNGKEIRLFPLHNNASGIVTIHGSDLQPGMYVYTLIADGKAIDSKKMILTSQ